MGERKVESSDENMGAAKEVFIAALRMGLEG